MQRFSQLAQKFGGSDSAKNRLSRACQGSGFSPFQLNPELWFDAPGPLITVDSALLFAAASSQYLSGSSTIGRLVNQDFSVCGWHKPTSTGADQYLCCDGESGGPSSGTFNFSVFLNHSDTTLRVSFSGYDDLLGSVTDIVGPAYSYGATFFWCLQYSQSTGLLTLSINDGGDVRATHTKTGTSNPVTELFRVGCSLAGPPDKFANGTTDEVLFYTKTLSAAQRTALYNGGVGKRYSDLSGSLLTNLPHAYRLNEPSDVATKSDSVGTMHLTATNAPVGTLGLVNPTKCDDGDPAASMGDTSGKGHTATAANGQRALVKLNRQNGLRCLLPDGIEDFMSILNALSHGGVTIYLVAKTAAGVRSVYCGSGPNAFGVSYNGTPSLTISKQSVATIASESDAPPLAVSYRTIAYVQGAGTAVVRRNGVDKTSFVGAQTCSGATNRLFVNNLGQYCNSDFFEMIVFTRVHTLAEMLQMEAWIRAKYAL